MHLWDLANGYAWLSKPDPAFERLIGNYDQLRRNFLAPDYIALTHDANVVKSVHVQAFGFADDPVAETTWLREQTSRYGLPIKARLATLHQILPVRWVRCGLLGIVPYL